MLNTDRCAQKLTSRLIMVTMITSFKMAMKILGLSIQRTPSFIFNGFRPFEYALSYFELALVFIAETKISDRANRSNCIFSKIRNDIKLAAELNMKKTLIRNPPSSRNVRNTDNVTMQITTLVTKVAATSKKDLMHSKKN